MAFNKSVRKSKRGITFPTRIKNKPKTKTKTRATRTSAEPINMPAESDSRLVELPSDNDEPPDLIQVVSSPASPPKPHLYTTFLPLRDELDTQTSKVQDETVEECLPFLTGRETNDFTLNSHGIPALQRRLHIRFIDRMLQKLPRAFVSIDASRPWLIYWSINGLITLGADLSSATTATDVHDYRNRAISTLTSCQSPHGGFGGSSHQFPHLACSYASVLTLVSLGGADAYDAIDRRAMWHFLSRMKQRDGGFTMCAGGEEDVRGAFCAMVIASLLDLPLEIAASEKQRLGGMETLTDGLAEWVRRCQTYEGGISSAPGQEAHGAYAFCALGCLAILGPPRQTIRECLDTGRFYAWLASRQHAPEGGFAGRTNKLVDGCYSHWCGGCWALLDAALRPASSIPTASGGDDGLWRRDGLARYILCCAQAPAGGLRDKPSKNPDGYHTNYNLAGLSWSQNRYAWKQTWLDADMASSGNALRAAFAWRVGGKTDVPCDEDDQVVPLHPVYVIAHDTAVNARRYFSNKEGF